MGNQKKLSRAALKIFWTVSDLIFLCFFDRNQPMDQHTYHVKAAQCRLRAQTEQDFAARSALEDLARDYLRLADGRGSETALTVDVQLESDRPRKTKHSGALRLGGQ
jgi:hypothetical protein